MDEKLCPLVRRMLIELAQDVVLDVENYSKEQKII